MTSVLGIDVGAVRLGWALVQSDNDTLTLLDSGVMGLARPDSMAYNEYRQALIDYWVASWDRLARLEPDLIASELLPAVGSGNFAVATQNQLVLTAVTCLQVLDRVHPFPVEWTEVPASTWKKQMHGMASKPPKTPKGKRVKISKVDTRNKVHEIFPETKSIDWSNGEAADRFDAIAIAACAAGYRHGK